MTTATFLFLVSMTAQLPPPEARLEVVVRDAASATVVPARIYLFDKKGALHAPPGAIVYRKHA